MWSTSSLPLLTLTGSVIPDKVLSVAKKDMLKVRI